MRKNVLALVNQEPWTCCVCGKQFIPSRFHRFDRRRRHLKRSMCGVECRLNWTKSLGGKFRAPADEQPAQARQVLEPSLDGLDLRVAWEQWSAAAMATLPKKG